MEAGLSPMAILPLPTEDDSLLVLDTKLSSYLYVVSIGASIDTATGRIVNQLNIKEAEIRAINGMKPTKREFFKG